jgi:lysozyme
MQLSNAGLNLFETGEGFVTHLHNCLANDATIGYGHLVHYGRYAVLYRRLHSPVAPVRRPGSVLLLQDVAYAAHAVEHLVTVPLTQGQYDALVSLTYNEGAGRLQTSTLLKVVNAGSYAEVPAEFMRWVYGGGAKVPGLVTRREAEAAKFEAT